MKEELLYYVWQNSLFEKNALQTTDKEAIELINLGTRNADAGPDFFNAKIKIGDTLWAGNVEIHVRASDWEAHEHHLNTAYDSTILHVVAINDKPVYRTNQQAIPTLILSIPHQFETIYSSLFEQQTWIRCANHFPEIDHFTRTFWIEKMMVERLEQKAAVVEQLLAMTNQSWEEVLYQHLARSFGFGLNADAFEQLARSLPLLVLAKHKSNLLQIEALLFGQSGLLQKAENPDEYTQLLLREYHVLKQKFSLTPLDGSQWKFLRLRPANFPSIRIAQFAALIHRSSSLFSRIREAKNLETLLQLFECTPSEYWQQHYTFGKISPQKQKSIGSETRILLIINTVVPLLFIWAKKNDNEEITNYALSLLEQMPSDQNSIISNWQALGLTVETAHQSQALLHAYQNYCQKGRCLQCTIGAKMFQACLR